MAESPNPIDTVDEIPRSSGGHDLVTMSRAEFDAILARIEPAGVSSRSVMEQERRASSLESQALLEEALAARDRRIAELEEACRAAVRDREIAAVLAGRPLVKGAASQLLRLWRDEFDVFEQDGAYRVAARDGRDVAQAVAERLNSAEYAHFCLPPSRGGSGARDAGRPLAPTGATPARNLGETVVQRWREEAATQAENFLQPIGLRRHR